MFNVASPDHVAFGDNSRGKGRQVELWRAPENDGIICLYLLLRLFEQPVDFRDLKNALADTKIGTSFVDLKIAARRFGLKTRVVKCGPTDLKRPILPVIAYIDGLKGDRGSFVLVLDQNHAGYHIVQGSTAVYLNISADDFRRRWSGYVLTRKPPWSGAALSLALGLITILVYWRWRIAPQRGAKSIDRITQSSLG